MKVKLLRDAKIAHEAGDFVEVSPAKCAFLLSVGSAELIEEEKPVAEKATAPAVEVAEKAVKAPKATTTAKKPTKATKATKATKKG